MIIDTSALVAIVRLEPDGPALERAIAAATVARISAATLVEVYVVIDGLRDPTASGALDAVLATASVHVEPFTAEQAAIARTAYQRFGKGSGHPAQLNMGDCFSYALARDIGEPLLFKGRDFALTDIEIVTTPLTERRLSEVIATYAAGTP